jgi:hypothetical protein
MGTPLDGWRGPPKTRCIPLWVIPRLIEQLVYLRWETMTLSRLWLHVCISTVIEIKYKMGGEMVETKKCHYVEFKLVIDFYRYWKSRLNCRLVYMKSICWLVYMKSITNRLYQWRNRWRLSPHFRSDLIGIRSVSFRNRKQIHIVWLHNCNYRQFLFSDYMLYNTVCPFFTPVKSRILRNSTQ